MTAKANAVLFLIACAQAACAQDGIEGADELITLDDNFFRCNVQPVLAARCSFMACHGNDERPLMLFAEQRFRLGISWEDYETPLTQEELAANLRMVRGFVSRDTAERNLLLQKPLDTRAGGFFHRGKDLYGSDDVFLSRQDVGYQALAQFSQGALASQDCSAIEEVGP